MPRDRSTIHLSDPAAMRALSHATRLRLLGELRTRGPQSVGMLADLVDEAPGSVSFHLRKLAEHGFVVEAPECARDRRERWWRAAHARTSWDHLEMLGDPERRAAQESMERSVLRRYLEQLESYLEGLPAQDPEWTRAGTSSDVVLHLTSAELAELHGELESLVERWEDRSDAERPGAEAVTLIFHAFRRPWRGRP